MKSVGMNSNRSIAVSIALLLVVQMVGLIAPYAMLHPISRGTWLANAAGSAGQIQIAIIWLPFNCLIALGIASALWRALRPHSAAGAKLLIGLSILMLVLQTADAVFLFRMLDLSKQNAGGVTGLEQAALDLAATRRWVHYSGLFSIDMWMFAMYVLLLRSNCVPRGIAGFGFLTVACHFFGLLLPMMAGGQGVTALGATMALGHLVLAGYLAVRGFLPIHN